MTYFDIFVAVVMGFSLIFAVMKGFVRGIFSLLAYVGGYFMATKYQGSFASVLMDSIPSQPIAKLIAFVTIYIMTAIIISLMGRVVRGLFFSTTGLSMLDRGFGGLVGLARGLAILLAVTFPLQFFPEVGKKFTKDSYTAPYLAKVLNFVSQNSGALNFKEKLSDFDMNGVKEKFEDLKDLKGLKDQFDDLKKNLPDIDKPQDEYSPEDKKKLEDILKSVGEN